MRSHHRAHADAIARRGCAHAAHHRGEGLPGEGVGEPGVAPVHVDHPRLGPDLAEPGGPEERVEPPADERVSSCARLEADQALDGGMRRPVVRVERGQAVVPLDGGDRPAGAQHAPDRAERPHRVLQVLEHEADEGVVERPGRERQRHHVGLAQLDVAQAGGPHARGRLAQRLRAARSRAASRRRRARVRRERSGGAREPGAARSPSCRRLRHTDGPNGIPLGLFARHVLDAGYPRWHAVTILFPSTRMVRSSRPHP